MTWKNLIAKICTLPDDEQEEACYQRDERLGILCGSAQPTEEELDIVDQQLFPTTTPP